jgi:hypothetical protein
LPFWVVSVAADITIVPSAMEATGVAAGVVAVPLLPHPPQPARKNRLVVKMPAAIIFVVCFILTN